MVGMHWTNNDWKTGRTIYGHKRKGDTRLGDTGLTLPPSQQARPAPCNIQRGGGAGALETSRGKETAQVASRAVPVPGPTVEQGVWAAKADPGTRVTMADLWIPWTMVDLGTRAAMAEQGTRAAMANLDIPWALADQGTPWVMAGSPPKKCIGEIAVRGRSGSADAWRHSGSAELDGASGDEGELDGASGDEGELGETSGDEGEIAVSEVTKPHCL